MAERDQWCRGVSSWRWHFVRAGAVQGACGVAVNGHLWPHSPTAWGVSCRSCVRIAGAAGLAATQPPASADEVDPHHPASAYGKSVAL
jgi:hypothetical protein